MFIYLHLCSAIIKFLLFLSLQFLIDSSHIDSISELFFLHLAPLYIIVIIHLLLKLIVQHILHLSLSIDDVLCDLLVFFRTEMRFRWLLDVLFVYLAPHLVHLDLLM